MNPETGRLELMERDALNLAEAVGPQRPPKKPARTGTPAHVTRPADTAESLTAKLEAFKAEFDGAYRVAEPEKLGWTTFTPGEVVPVKWAKEGDEVQRETQEMTVKNLNADGLLLRGPKIAATFSKGHEVTVKGERCEVVKVSSRGMFVRGVV